MNPSPQVRKAKYTNYFPVIFLVIMLTVLAYGLLIQKLGFYLDDWYIVYTNEALGPQGFNDFFEGVRPLFPFVYQTFVPIFRDSPLAWQVFALVTRIIVSLSFYFLLDLLLPKQKIFTAAVVGLFTVFPAFRFHWFATMFGQYYLLMALYFASYILMLAVMRERKPALVFTFLGMICNFLGIAPIEYFFGLELVRPLVIYIALLQKGESRSLAQCWRSILRYWLPYLIVFLGFGLYRVLNSSEYGYRLSLLDSTRGDFWGMLLGILQNIGSGLYEGFLGMWSRILELLKTPKGSTTDFLSFLVLAATALLVYLGFRVIQSRNKGEDLDKKMYPAIIVLGVYATVSAMLPFLVADFKLDLSFANNRFFLPLSVGISLASVGLLFFLVKNQKARALLLALLIGLASSGQFMQAKDFADAWEAQRRFFSQLAWRVPSLEPGTALVTDDLYFSQYSYGGSLTAAMNLIYAPEHKGNPIPYFIYLGGTPQSHSLKGLEPDQPLSPGVFAAKFVGNTSDTIAFVFPEKGCLRIIPPEASPLEFLGNPNYALWEKALAVSSPGRILMEPGPASQQVANYYGALEGKDWCYYYTRAELAAQQGKWGQVIQLYDEARHQDIHPELEIEYLPLMEALLHKGQFEVAEAYTRELSMADVASSAAYCKLWQGAVDAYPGLDPKISAGILEKYHCLKP
jgi:hypothetical protein